MIRRASRPGLRAIADRARRRPPSSSRPAPPPAPPPKPATDAKPAASTGGSTITGDAANGRTLFTAKGCIACHTAQGVQGATGTIGPNLNGIGDPAKKPKLTDGGNNTPEHIREWIKDPQKLKPGTHDAEPPALRQRG